LNDCSQKNESSFIFFKIIQTAHFSAASNWSKVERGINPPPGDIEFLEKLADFFDLTGAEKLALIDEAALQRKELPPDIAGDEILQEALPAFFRAARSHKLSEAELKQFANDIRRLHVQTPASKQTVT
jgi:transcriptional regulator with XRE-family HTH domain